MYFWSISLVDQLSGKFHIFFGRPKRNCPVSGNFWSGSDFFWSTKSIFGIPKFLFSIPKNQSLTKKNSDVPSMWFWSVSWSTNCPVYFSLFLSTKKKNFQSQGIFGQALMLFGRPNFFGIPKFLFSIPKNQSMTKKNSETNQKFPETGQFLFWLTKKNEK